MHVALTVWSALLSGALVVTLLHRKVLVLRAVRSEEARLPLGCCDPEGNERVWSACPNGVGISHLLQVPAHVPQKKTPHAQGQHNIFINKSENECKQNTLTCAIADGPPSKASDWLVPNLNLQVHWVLWETEWCHRAQRKHNQQHTVFVLGMIDMFW